MALELDDLDLTHNPRPVCPYCGSEEHNAWELEGKLTAQEVECWRCGETYLAEGEAIVFWTTRKKAKP